MKQENYTAILIQASDYREYDKLVRLFTAEGSVVRAVMKGVKRPSAKLKFGAQPFALCEYGVVSKNGYNTVISCSPIEDLFALTSDYGRYECASIMCEAAEAAAGEGAYPSLFVFLLRSLKELLYGKTEPQAVTKSFLEELMFADGYTPETPLAGGLKNAVRLFEESYSHRLKSAGRI
ncbi:MAG: DNA repair protein RecO [Clostridiales bacterium]|nr:DNA repair protein RecO [Clostridiales bacterium]